MAGEFDDAWFQELYGRVTTPLPGQSGVADFFRDPEGYGVPPERAEATKAAMLRALVDDPVHAVSLFGRSHNQDAAALTSDTAVIGAELRTAFDSGAITTEDLLKVAEKGHPAFGAKDLMPMLLPEGTGIGSAGEAFAERLQERNQGNDAAVAAMAFTSSPDLMAKHLDTPEKRADAFEALLTYNDTMAKADANGPAVDQGIVAISKLYDAHAEEIVARYAPGDSGESHAEHLSWFYSQTIFNPRAKDLEVSPGQSVTDSVSGRTGDVVDGILKSMHPSDPNSIDDATIRLGRLSAAMAGGVDYATQIHAGLIERDRANAEFIASGIDALAGKIPVAGEYVGQGVDMLTDHLVDRAGADRLAPDPSVAELFHDRLSAAAGGEESRIGYYKLYEDMRDERDSEYNEHLLDLIGKGPRQDPTSTQDGASLGTESIATEKQALLTSPDHPQHARYAGCLDACADPSLGLATGDRPNAAAALAAQSMADGLSRVDTVVQNRDATLLIGVMGNVEDPASRRTVLPRDVAVEQTVEASTQKVDTLIEQQNKLAPTQSPERELAPRSVMV